MLKRPRCLSVVLSLLLLLTFQAQGAVLRCLDLDVAVYHENNTEDAKTACTAARKAITFMADHGFDTEVPIRIEVVGYLVNPHFPQIIGEYDSHTFQIRVLSLESCHHVTKDTLTFGMTMNAALHQSYIVHEVAHAFAHHNFKISRPPVVSHEYIAYTVQLATMETSLRKQILNTYPNGAFKHDREITYLFLALGPEVFAVKAYRHFQDPQHGAHFYKRLLTGDFRPNRNY